jgi:hypothetical protein
MKKEDRKANQDRQRSTRAHKTVADPEKYKNPAAVSLGRLGGLVGGKARAQKLTAGQRSEIARRAAEARWKNRSVKSKQN